MSALNLLLVCSQWLSVCDVWRLHYSSQCRIVDLHNVPSSDVRDDADGQREDDLHKFVDAGFKAGRHICVVDTVLLHLYVVITC
jgi:hypothetical protein